MAMPKRPEPLPRPLPVFLLAGQSNMDGRGWTRDLPPRLTRPQPEVLIWWHRGELGYASAPGEATDHWAALEPGMNLDRFGPEITLGLRLRRALGRPIAFIKVSRGGTSLGRDWNPAGSPMWNALAAQWPAALEALRARGFAPDLRAVFWHQGESDAAPDKAAEAGRYEARLRDFLAAVRRLLNAAHVPFFIGELGDCAAAFPYRDAVAVAQRAVAAGPARAADTYFVAAKDLPSQDDAQRHFGSEANLTLGERFAEAYLKLHEKDP